MGCFFFCFCGSWWIGQDWYLFCDVSTGIFTLPGDSAHVRLVSMGILRVLLDSIFS